ncbi:C39 family peptidase [Microcoleus sp. herbarium7]|uniref:C39 family peptidase n=1 Tax=Microcoleus sp. herbarium7 TaxID=3055435 RepID=UPI002FD3E2F5
MRLQNFLNSKIRYDARAIAADDDLSRQIQSRLIDLGLLKPPVDGVFGPLSTAALHRFQTLMKCGEPGFLGAVTAKKLIEAKPADIPKPAIVLKTVRDTVFKSKPLASSQLQESEKQIIPAGKQFELLAFAPIRGHVRVALRNESFKGSGIWYVYGPHAQITQDSVVLFPKPNPPTVRLGIPYRSQMDNFYNPTGACNVTSIAMCLDFLRIPRRKRTGQYEDELYEYAIAKGYSRWDPYDLAKIAVDYGAKDFYTENATIDDVQDWLASGNPAVIHGYFTSFGHIIVAAGYDSEGFFVHDPYGEWFPTGYDTTVSGAYLHYSYRLIRNVCMADGNFWVHFISK